MSTDARRSQVVATDSAAVLVTPVPPSHDPGWRESVALGNELSSRLHASLVGVEYFRREDVLATAQLVLGEGARWGGWRVAVSCLAVRSSVCEVLNCGMHTVVVFSEGAQPMVVSEPQTIGRRFRSRDGVVLPESARDIAAILVGPNSEPADIDRSSVSVEGRGCIVAIAEPRLSRAVLARLGPTQMACSSIPNVIERAARELMIPNDAFGLVATKPSCCIHP